MAVVTRLPVVLGARQQDFVDFYGRESVSIERYARAILGRQAAGDVDDVVQEAWTKAWRSWDAGSPERRAAWMFRIVRNCCLDRLRDSAKEPGLRMDAPADLLVAEEPALPRLEATAAVALLDALSRPLRDALYLRVVEERSYDEIASTLGIPIGTVMSRLHAARRTVAKRMGPR